MQRQRRARVEGRPQKQGVRLLPRQALQYLVRLFLCLHVSARVTHDMAAVSTALLCGETIRSNRRRLTFEAPPVMWHTLSFASMTSACAVRARRVVCRHSLRQDMLLKPPPVLILSGREPKPMEEAQPVVSLSGDIVVLRQMRAADSRRVHYARRATTARIVGQTLTKASAGGSWCSEPYCTAAASRCRWARPLSSLSRTSLSRASTAAPVAQL